MILADCNGCSRVVAYRKIEATLLVVEPRIRINSRMALSRSGRLIARPYLQTSRMIVSMLNAKRSSSACGVIKSFSNTIEPVNRLFR